MAASAEQGILWAAAFELKLEVPQTCLPHSGMPER